MIVKKPKKKTILSKYLIETRFRNTTGDNWKLVERFDLNVSYQGPMVLTHRYGEIIEADLREELSDKNPNEITFTWIME